MDKDPEGARVEGNQITVGNIEDSVAAVGAGATAIVNNIHYHLKHQLTDIEVVEQAETREHKQLAEAVEMHLARLQKKSAQALQKPTRSNPFKALLHYELTDLGRFFGRDAQASALLEAVDCQDLRCRLAILYGDSGVGKTSLLWASIIPGLVANQHLPLYIRLTPSSGISIATRIKKTLLPDLSATPLLEKASLQVFIRRVAALLPEGKHLFVILDQFENFFELPLEMRRLFVEELSQSLFDDELRDNWLISIRSFRFSHLSTFQPAIPQPFANTFVLPPLSHESAREAIVEAAKVHSLTFEEKLLNQLLLDLDEVAIDPSRLQLVCHALVEELPEGQSHLTLDIYRQLGGVEGVLHNYLDTVLANNLPPGDREAAWYALVAVAGKQSLTATDHEILRYLSTYGVSQADAQRVLALLEVNRLLRKEVNQLLHKTENSFQLTSESLLPRIRQWAIERAALEKAREEAVRQFERIRGSALRGLLGGGLGFSLAYLITYTGQVNDKSLLGYFAILEALPGAISGFFLLLSVDMALASYHGPHRWLRWTAGALAGAASFAFAMLSHGILNFSGTAGLAAMVIEGALWGLVIGLGTVWVLTSKRPLWQTLPVVVVASGVTLWLAEFLGHAFGDPQYSGLVALAGGVMPLFVLLVARLARASRI